MVMQVTFKTTIDAAYRALNEYKAKQIPFAAAQALNDTLFDIKYAVQKEIIEVFKDPVPRTRKSVRVQRATKQRMFARAYIDDEPDKGTAPQMYLQAEVYGGVRSLKRFERALQLRGIMPPGTFAVPAEGIKLTGAFVMHLLAYFSALQEVGYKGNMTAATRAKLAGLNRVYAVRDAQAKRPAKATAKRPRAASNSAKPSTPPKARAPRKPKAPAPNGQAPTLDGFVYFAANGSSPRTKHLHPGIYRRATTKEGKLTPIVLFVNSASYTVKLPFDAIADEVAELNFKKHFGKRLAKAIATAK